MAFWKIVGFEVTPTTPSSIIRSRLPLWMSSRESESIQTLCPIPASLRKRSFIFLLLRFHPPPELSNSYPKSTPGEPVLASRNVPPRDGCPRRPGAEGLFHTHPIPEETER